MQQVEIIVKGHLDLHWSDWLAGLTITHTAASETVLSGVVPDQSALYGLLSKLRDLGLALISVDCTPVNGPASVLAGGNDFRT